MELVTGQTIYYSNKNHLPIDDVANSLLALQSFISATPTVLAKLFPSVQIQKVEVFVNEVKTGSLLEDLAIKFIWGNQEKLDRSVLEARENLKVDTLLSNRLLIGTIIGALVMAGGMNALKKLNGTSENTKNLQANQNIFIYNGANIAGVTEEAFSNAIAEAFKKHSTLEKDSIKFVKPASKDSNAEIVLNESSQNTITNQSVKSMPLTSLETEEEDDAEDYSNVEIQIRAIDLDSTKRGWAAVIPSVSPRRIKMHLDPHIKVHQLLGKSAIQGDVTVIFQPIQGGERVPRLIFLRHIEK